MPVERIDEVGAAGWTSQLSGETPLLQFLLAQGNQLQPPYITIQEKTCSLWPLLLSTVCLPHSFSLSLSPFVSSFLPLSLLFPPYPSLLFSLLPSFLPPSFFVSSFFFISFLLPQLLFVYLFLSEYTQKPIACVPSLYSACVQDASGISLIDEILSIDGSEIFCEIFIYRLQLGLYIEEWGGGSRAILSLSLVSFSLSRKHTHTYTHFNKYKCPQTCQMPV